MSPRRYKRIYCIKISEKPPMHDIITKELISLLMRQLPSKEPQLQYECACTLKEITSLSASSFMETFEDCQVGESFSKLFGLLSSGFDEITEPAVWTLGNIGNDQLHRSTLLEHGVIQHLLQVLETSNNRSITYRTTWALANSVKNKPKLGSYEVVKAALPVMVRLANSEDELILTEACRGLSYLSDYRSETQLQLIIDTRICERASTLLSHPSFTLQRYAVIILANITVGSDQQTQYIIDLGILPKFVRLLQTTSKICRRHICWAVSNMTAGRYRQIQAVIDANMIPPLVQLLSNSELLIQKEIVWIFSNALSGGSRDQAACLAAGGCVKPLCDILLCSDFNVVRVALEAVDTLLRLDPKYAVLVREVGGVEKLQATCVAKNGDAANAVHALRILETHFEPDSSDSENEHNL